MSYFFIGPDVSRTVKRCTLSLHATRFPCLSHCNGRGNGIRALSACKAAGHPHGFTGAKERQVFRWINGKNPM